MDAAAQLTKKWLRLKRDFMRTCVIRMVAALERSRLADGGELKPLSDDDIQKVFEDAESMFWEYYRRTLRDRAAAKKGA